MSQWLYVDGYDEFIVLSQQIEKFFGYPFACYELGFGFMKGVNGV